MDERTKKILDREKDPRILRALLESALEHIESQKKIIDQHEREKADRAQSAFILEEQVKLLRRQIYGKSSEKREDPALEANDRPRDKSQEEALLFSQAAFPSIVVRDPSVKGKAKGRELEDVIVDHYPSETDLSEEAKLRGLRGVIASDWHETGLYDESVKIQIIERRYVLERHRRHKRKLDSRFTDEKEIIVTAKASPELLPGMNYTTEFVASVVSDKYISHMPLERQTREMESLGLVQMKNSTLSRLSALAAASLEPLAEKILSDDLLTSKDFALHLDETPWKIQNKDEKDGYMWVVSNKFGSHYFYRPTRSAKVIKDRLGHYSGPVVTDGYRPYDEILRELVIPHAYCWAHVRREFFPLETHDPSVKPILDLIDKLFEVEREAKSFAELKTLRDERSRKLASKLHALLAEFESDFSINS